MYLSYMRIGVGVLDKVNRQPNSEFANFDIWMCCEEDTFSQNTQYSIFYAFAALSLNDVLSNFDIWMHNKEGASATDRSVLVVREGWCGSA